MSLKDLLAANALVKLSPFLVVGGLLATAVALRDLGNRANISRSESTRSTATFPGMATCSQAAARYNKDQWKSHWDSQEIICKEAESPGTYTRKCIEVASNIVLDKPLNGADLDITCFGASESDRVKVNCLSGTFHLSQWVDADCTKLTGMSYSEFMSKP